MQWLPAILIIPYLFFFWIFTEAFAKSNHLRSHLNPGKFVSVVIACRNEEESVAAAPENLSDQDYPSHLFEVIIVNDNSTDKTFDIASSFSGNCSIQHH